MKETLRQPDRSLVFFAPLVLSLFLTSCNGAIAINENTIWYGSDRMRNDPEVVAHEMCHQKQMKKEGGSDIFWHKYFNKDNSFRCKAELACGADETHWACDDIKLQLEEDVAVEVILAP